MADLPLITVHNPNHKLGKSNYSSFKTFLKTSPLVYRSPHNFLQKTLNGKIDEKVANKIIFNFIDALIRESNEPGKLSTDKKQNFDKLFSALERMAIQTKVKVLDYLHALYSHFSPGVTSSKTYLNLQLDFEGSVYNLYKIIFEALDKLNKAELTRLLKTNLGKSFSKEGYIAQPKNMSRPTAIDKNREAKSTLRNDNEASVLESEASTEYLINQLEQVSKQVAEPFSRRDFFREAGGYAKNIALGAIGIGVPAATIGASTGRNVLQEHFKTVEAPKSEEESLIRIEQLDNAERSGMTQLAIPSTIIGSIFSGIYVSQDDLKKRALIEKIIHGLWQQPIGQNISKRNFDYITRQDFFKHFGAALALKVGIIGTVTSVLAAQPYRLRYGTPAERELKAIDPKNQMDFRVRKKHAWKIFLSDLLNKGLFYGTPIVALSFPMILMNDETNLKRLDYLIKAANKLPEKISLRTFAENGAIVCQIQDNDWFDTKMKKEDEFALYIKDLEEKNIIRLDRAGSDL